MNFFSVSDSLTHLESFIPRSLPTKSKIDFLYEAYTNKKSYFCHKNQSDSDRHNILLNGIYALYLKHWFRTFRRDQILVLDGQKLLSEPAQILKVYVFCRNCSFYTLRMKVNINLSQAWVKLESSLSQAWVKSESILSQAWVKPESSLSQTWVKSIWLGFQLLGALYQPLNNTLNI